MTQPIPNDSSTKPFSLPQWLGRYRCKAGVQLSRHEGSHLLDRVTAPLPMERSETPEIAFSGAV